MASNTPNATKEKDKTESSTNKDGHVSPFAIEADHHRNCDLLIQCITGLKLRSRLTSNRTVRTHDRTGNAIDVVPRDQGIGLGMYPELPGMQLHLHPEKLRYRIIDPMHGDTQLCLRLKTAMNENSGFRTAVTFDGVPPQEGTLSQHHIKTLAREMYNLVSADEARVIEGDLPELRYIESLPGKFLMNPGIRTQTTQPTFEDDWDDWFTNFKKAGG